MYVQPPRPRRASSRPSATQRRSVAALRPRALAASRALYLCPVIVHSGVRVLPGGERATSARRPQHRIEPAYRGERRRESALAVPVGTQTAQATATPMPLPANQPAVESAAQPRHHAYRASPFRPPRARTPEPFSHPGVLDERRFLTSAQTPLERAAREVVAQFWGLPPSGTRPECSSIKVSGPPDCCGITTDRTRSVDTCQDQTAIEPGLLVVTLAGPAKPEYVSVPPEQRAGAVETVTGRPRGDAEPPSSPPTGRKTPRAAGAPRLTRLEALSYPVVGIWCQRGLGDRPARFRSVPAPTADHRRSPPRECGARAVSPNPPATRP